MTPPTQLASSMTACEVCGHGDVRHFEIVVDSSTDRRRPAAQCGDCGFIALADARAGSANTKQSPRLGTAERAGRNHAMAQLGASLLIEREINVLLWEPGATQDIGRIGALADVASVVSACSPNSIVPDDAAVTKIDTAQASTRYFDLTLVNEVAQTLERPRADLAAMLRSVNSHGLVILSTDLYDGSDLDTLSFPRAPSHRWFWTGAAMARIAEQEALHIDVRLPKIAAKKKFWRKRYVFFSPDPQIMQRVRLHFGSTLHAPSEAT